MNLKTFIANTLSDIRLAAPVLAWETRECFFDVALDDQGEVASNPAPGVTRLQFKVMMLPEKTNQTDASAL